MRAARGKIWSLCVLPEGRFDHCAHCRREDLIARHILAKYLLTPYLTKVKLLTSGVLAYGGITPRDRLTVMWPDHVTRNLSSNCCAWIIPLFSQNDGLISFNIVVFWTHFDVMHLVFVVNFDSRTCNIIGLAIPTSVWLCNQVMMHYFWLSLSAAISCCLQTLALSNEYRTGQLL